MNLQEIVVTKFSQYDDPQLKDKTKDELLGNIKSDSVDISVMKGNMVGDIQVVSYSKMISITMLIRK